MDKDTTDFLKSLKRDSIVFSALSALFFAMLVYSVAKSHQHIFPAAIGAITCPLLALACWRTKRSIERHQVGR